MSLCRPENSAIQKFSIIIIKTKQVNTGLTVTAASKDHCVYRMHRKMVQQNRLALIPQHSLLSVSVLLCPSSRDLLSCNLGQTHDTAVTSAIRTRPKLQALVSNILPSTTAVFSYVIGSRKLSANEQFFGGAQTVVSLLQTTQIKQGVSFIAANKVYTSTNKTTIV